MSVNEITNNNFAAYVLKPGVALPQSNGSTAIGPKPQSVSFGQYTIGRPSYSTVKNIDGSAVSTGAYAYGGGIIYPGDKQAGEVNRTPGEVSQNGIKHKYSMTYYA